MTTRQKTSLIGLSLLAVSAGVLWAWPDLVRYTRIERM
jgi:hypothetical protein